MGPPAPPHCHVYLYRCLDLATAGLNFLSPIVAEENPLCRTMSPTSATPSASGSTASSASSCSERHATSASRGIVT